jgi:Trk K+ transport system NAD-binding subunit
VIDWALRRWTDLEAYDFVELLELAEGYRVRSIGVDAGDWVEGRRLDDLELFNEGITVLGIHRPDGSYLGVPRGETTVWAGDGLVLYGRDERLRELEDRRIGESGSRAHRQAMADHERLRRVPSRSEEAVVRGGTGGPSPR